MAIERLPYFPEQVLNALADVENLILVGGEVPASFFAYRNTPGQLIPDSCQVTRLSSIEEDSVDALERLVDRLGANTVSYTHLTLPTKA